jgi:hypothetical protein
LILCYLVSSYLHFPIAVKEVNYLARENVTSSRIDIVFTLKPPASVAAGWIMGADEEFYVRY